MSPDMEEFIRLAMTEALPICKATRALKEKLAEERLKACCSDTEKAIEELKRQYDAKCRELERTIGHVIVSRHMEIFLKQEDQLHQKKLFD